MRERVAAFFTQAVDPELEGFSAGCPKSDDFFVRHALRELQWRQACTMKNLVRVRIADLHPASVGLEAFDKSSIAPLDLREGAYIEWMVDYEHGLDEMRLADNVKQTRDNATPASVLRKFTTAQSEFSSEKLNRLVAHVYAAVLI